MSTLATTGFPRPVQIEVFDMQNKLFYPPIALIAPDSGPGIARDTGYLLLTDRNGQAATTLRANDQVGTFNLALKVDGVAGAKTVTLTILPVPTSVTLEILPEEPTQDDTITLRAAVKSDYGEPTGSIEFTQAKSSLAALHSLKVSPH